MKFSIPVTMGKKKFFEDHFPGNLSMPKVSVEENPANSDLNR